MRSLQFFLAGILVATAITRAAEQRFVSCRLLNFQRDGGGVSEVFVLSAEGEALKCDVPRDNLSKPVPLPVVGKALVFRSEADGPPVSSPKVSENLRDALVLFLPPEKPDAGFRAVVIDGSEKSFPESGSLVLNLYSEEVRFVLGEHKILLPAGKTATLQRPAERDNFNMAAVMFQFRSKTGWRSAYETKSRFPEGQRHLYVSYVDPKGNRPRIRAYRD
ncbi:MAG: hypothetical protein H7A50_08505 [Akkermansiaceae bacterium]|nr:hypothetical protein [Akkermansiaceae bacterium]